MTCTTVKKYVAAFVDRELSAWRTRALADHFMLCASCFRRLLVQLRIKALLRRHAKNTAAPPQLRQRIQRALTKEK